MKFYATIEPIRKLKNLFTNLSQFYIIDVDTILAESAFNLNKVSHQFLVSSEIERLIITGARSKRYMGMIYINSSLDNDIISSIREKLDTIENSYIEAFVILDDYDTPKLKNLYQSSDEVVFFPSLKKTRIIECVPKIIPKIKNHQNENI